MATSYSRSRTAATTACQSLAFVTRCGGGSAWSNCPCAEGVRNSRTFTSTGGEDRPTIRPCAQCSIIIRTRRHPIVAVATPVVHAEDGPTSDDRIPCLLPVLRPRRRRDRARGTTAPRNRAGDRRLDHRRPPSRAVPRCPEYDEPHRHLRGGPRDARGRESPWTESFRPRCRA